MLKVQEGSTGTVVLALLAWIATNHWDGQRSLDLFQSRGMGCIWRTENRARERERDEGEVIVAQPA